MKLKDVLAQKRFLRGGESDKQVIQTLLKKKQISRAAARAIAARYDEGVEKELKDPLGAALAAYDRGDLEIAVKEGGEAKKPSLADTEPTATAKQRLLQLYRGGSLSLEQTKEASAALDEGTDLGAALHGVGATHLLPEKMQKGLAADRKEATTPPATPPPTTPPADPPPPSDEGEPPITTTFVKGVTKTEFSKLDHRRAIAIIEADVSEPERERFFRAELERERGPRPSVMDAFKAKGLEAPPPAQE